MKIYDHTFQTFQVIQSFKVNKITYAKGVIIDLRQTPIQVIRTAEINCYEKKWTTGTHSLLKHCPCTQKSVCSLVKVWKLSVDVS